MRKASVVFTILTLLALASPFTAANAFAATGQPTSSKSFTTTDSPNVLVNPLPGPSVSKQLETRARASWPWYLTRASGFVAAFSLILLMLSGVGFITGTTFRFLEPLTAWATHKAIALLFGVSVIIHGVALLFDKFVPFSIAQVLIPFMSHYRQVTIGGHHLGSLYVALGIIAFYLILAIILSSLLWIDKKPHTWKLIHFLAYLTMIFVFFHALYIGTDLAHGVFRILWIILGSAVAVAIVYRLRRRAQTR